MTLDGITVAGNLIMDIIYTVDKYPEKGNLSPIYSPMHSTGGINNLLIDLARLDRDLPLRVSGLLGEDEYGREILQTLSNYGNIDISNICKYGRTAVTYVMMEKKSKMRTFFCDAGDSFSYDEKHINLSNLSSKIFHLEYLLYLGELDGVDEKYGTKAAKILAHAQQLGMKTSIDVVSDERRERYPQIVWPALPYVDYCIINEIEASSIVQEQIYNEDGLIKERAWSALDKINELGVKEWIVIHSPDKSAALNCKTKEKILVESYKLPQNFIKGTTGAGDAFCAGVLWAAYKDKDLKTAVELGNKCAVCSLSQADSNSGIPEFKFIDDFIEGIGNIDLCLKN